jgi:hypothetical protein
MSFGIASGWNRPLVPRTVAERIGNPYVVCDVYGTGVFGGVDPAELGTALGTLYRAADAAFQVDSFGRPKIRYKSFSSRVHLVLEFNASSDDVVTGGPLHYQRACRCLGAMVNVVEKAFDEEMRTRR